MDKRVVTLNILMLRADKEALDSYARAQGENISVVVRKIIKEELIRKGFLQPTMKVDSHEHQDQISE